MKVLTCLKSLVQGVLKNYFLWILSTKWVRQKCKYSISISPSPFQNRKLSHSIENKFSEQGSSICKPFFEIPWEPKKLFSVNYESFIIAPEYDHKLFKKEFFFNSFYLQQRKMTNLAYLQLYKRVCQEPVCILRRKFTS